MSASERAEIARTAPILKVLPQFIDVRTANDLRLRLRPPAASGPRQCLWEWTG